MSNQSKKKPVEASKSKSGVKTPKSSVRVKNEDAVPMGEYQSDFPLRNPIASDARELYLRSRKLQSDKAFHIHCNMVPKLDTDIAMAASEGSNAMSFNLSSVESFKNEPSSEVKAMAMAHLISYCVKEKLYVVSFFLDPFLADSCSIRITW